MSWCQGFVGQVNDPLSVGFFPWRTLVGPKGGMGVGLCSQEVELSSWEGWVGLCLGGTYYLATLPGGVVTLPCLGGARGMRGAVSLTVYMGGSSLGWVNIFWGKVWSSREKTASFPGRKVSHCWTWCLGSVSTVAFWGRVYSCWERIASFPGRKVSNCLTRETAWCLDTGRAVTFWGRVYSCQGENCFPPWEGGEQWLVWGDCLQPDLLGWVDCLLPDCCLGVDRYLPGEGDHLLGDCLLPWEEGEQWPGWGCRDLPD